MTSSLDLTSSPRSWLRMAAVLIAAVIFTAAGVAAEQLYTCGMHPQIIKKEPGNCPICGMKLTPIHGTAGKAAALKGERTVKYYKSTMIPGEVKPAPGKDSMGMDMVPVYEGDDASSGSAIQIDAGTRQRMNLRTAKVERGPVRRQIRTVGSVAFNEEGLRDITTKYEGWIEKLFVNTTYAVVKKDEPLFEMYSPDLYNAQLNYLVAVRAEGNEGGPLSRAALARLQLYDVPASFVEELKSSGEAKRTFVFRAPSDGIVVEKMALVGQMMKPGERIYRLADLSSVWVQAQVYEKDLPFVQAGLPAVIRSSYGPERDFKGSVALVLPQVQEETRSAIARIVLPNTDMALRPGMFVDVEFVAELKPDAVLVPDMAVLRSGEHNTVFVALAEGAFEPRTVTLGARSGADKYEVLSGLNAGDVVVTSGQFMLDSESQLREAIQKMLTSPASAAAAPAQAPEDSAEMEHAGHAAAEPAATHAGHAMPAMPAPEQTDVAASASGALEALAGATADASAVLGADDLAAYTKLLPTLRSDLEAVLAADPHAGHGPLGAAKERLVEPASLEQAREGYARFSNAVAQVVRQKGISKKLGLHIYECPMAPGGKARWIQRTGEKRNPFFGSDMPNCGTEVGEDQAAVRPASRGGMRLPPGHPPIPQTDIVDFLRTVSASQSTSGGASASGEACGSCGMTAEAMAAGEPCEHGPDKSVTSVQNKNQG